MMTFISAFVVCGGICLAGQLIYDNTKLTAGHITSIFVVIGAALDTFGCMTSCWSLPAWGPPYRLPALDIL